jgi:hypothetical protein
MKRLTRTSVILFGLIILPGTSTFASEIGYQQTIKTRCETISLDPKFIPAACFVEVTQSGVMP